MIHTKADLKLAMYAFGAGSIFTSVLMYQYHQRTLKFIGVAYGIAHDEIQELKGRSEE